MENLCEGSGEKCRQGRGMNGRTCGRPLSPPRRVGIFKGYRRLSASVRCIKHRHSPVKSKGGSFARGREVAGRLAIATADGTCPKPGGGNRFAIDVEVIDRRCPPKTAIRFREWQQILVDDPSGNPIELFQPANRSAS